MKTSGTFSKRDFAILNLGRVHSYVEFLIGHRLLPGKDLRIICHQFYLNHPEIGVSFDEALKVAILRRDEAFALARNKLKADRKSE